MAPFASPDSAFFLSIYLILRQFLHVAKEMETGNPSISGLDNSRFQRWRGVMCPSVHEPLLREDLIHPL
jgi:hypothetical protein